MEGRDDSGQHGLEIDVLDGLGVLRKRVVRICEGTREASDVVGWKKELYYAKPRGPSRVRAV